MLTRNELDTFFVSEEELRNSPSRKHGIDEETETTLRIFGCELVQEAGILLKCPQAVMVTGQVLLHRFYCRKSMREFNVRVSRRPLRHGCEQSGRNLAGPPGGQLAQPGYALEPRCPVERGRWRCGGQSATRGDHRSEPLTEQRPAAHSPLVALCVPASPHSAWHVHACSLPPSWRRAHSGRGTFCWSLTASTSGETAAAPCRC